MARRLPSGAPGSLPEAVTSFVGRRCELAAARQRMQEGRLVTLTGPGGVGKTRLALQVAGEVRGAYADGVWLVDLAPLTDGSRLAQTVLSALGVRDQSARRADEQLAEHLRDRHLLMVLDNCEHLLDACAQLVDGLLRNADGLHVLATSREGLAISGEHVLVVPPLSTPGLEASPPLDVLAGYDSVGLLVDRARAVRPDFELTEGNREAVAQLCAWLDGVPLAIELAATRLRSLSVGEVVERLGDRFALLTGGNRAALPRQKTLRALIDWSHELCTAEEQLLWARLSVFPGSFDLAAAEGVCAGDVLASRVVVDLLDHLVAKSIVLAERRGDGRQRYRMLVTVREYGAVKLAELGEDVALRRRHRDHFHAQARDMLVTWCGPGQAAWLERMRLDHPNLRAALEWSMATPGEAGTGARLAAALRWHWVVGGFLGEGSRWLAQALEVVGDGTTDRGEALWVAAWIELVKGEREPAAAHLEAAGAIVAAHGDAALGAHVGQWTGILRLFSGDPEAAVPLFERAVAAHAVAGHASAGLFSLFQLAVARVYAGDTGRARRTAEEAIRRSTEHGERWGRAYALWVLGIVALREGDLEAARTAEEEALEIQRGFEDGICSALAMEALAWASCARGTYAETARLLGAAKAVWTAIGTSVGAFGPLAGDSQYAAGTAGEAIGPERFAAFLDCGTGLGVGAAIAFALDGAAPVPAEPAAGVVPRLSAREDEVARLVAEGLSNRAIAERLVLSPRTIDGHVERIFAKLGFSSRAQVAAWTTEHAAGAV